MRHRVDDDYYTDYDDYGEGYPWRYPERARAGRTSGRQSEPGWRGRRWGDEFERRGEPGYDRGYGERGSPGGRYWGERGRYGERDWYGDGGWYGDYEGGRYRPERAYDFEPGRGGGRGFWGRGPRGYQRSDDRICEDVCQRLTDHPRIDASDIEVNAKGGIVTLGGTVDERFQKRMAEDIAEDVSGVKDVNNQLGVRERLDEEPSGRIAT